MRTTAIIEYTVKVTAKLHIETNEVIDELLQHTEKIILNGEKNDVLFNDIVSKNKILSDNLPFSTGEFVTNNGHEPITISFKGAKISEITVL